MPGYLRERDLEMVLSLSLWSRVVQVQEGEEPGPEQSRACLPLLTASLKSMGCRSLGAPWQPSVGMTSLARVQGLLGRVWAGSCLQSVCREA